MVLNALKHFVWRGMKGKRLSSIQVIVISSHLYPCDPRSKWNSWAWLLRISGPMVIIVKMTAMDKTKIVQMQNYGSQISLHNCWQASVTMLGLSLYFSYSQKKWISCKDYSTVKTDLAWSAIVAASSRVTDNVHLLTRGCCIRWHHHTVVPVLLQIQGAGKG